MIRTAGLDADNIGRARSLVWEPTEIGFDAVAIAGSGFHESEVFYVEGFRHFHVYVHREPSRNVDIFVRPILPTIDVGAPVSAVDNPILLAAWTGASQNGVFYFGEQSLLAGTANVSFLLSPVMAIRVENATVNNLDTVSVRVHAQD